MTFHFTEKRAKLVADARAKLAEAEVAGLTETRAKEIEAEYDKIMLDVDRLDARINRELRLEAVADPSRTPDTAEEIRANGEGIDATRVGKASEIEKRAFANFIRKGREALSADEIRAMKVSDDTTGGYLAPTDFAKEVIKGVVQFSPVRQVARVGTTSSGSVTLPKRTGTPTAQWTGEIEDREETESAYGQLEITIHEAACYVDVSNKLLDDGAVDVAAEVAFDLSEEFGRIEGAAFVNGNGVKKPLGFMQDTTLDFKTSGDAANVTSDGLFDLFYAMAPFYRNRGSFILNGATLGTVRKLKDGQGRYVWQPGLQAGQPDTLLGRPVIEAVDMPDVAGGAFPVVFGDFESAFRIYDRVQLALLRDPYSQATKGMTRFHARRRVGGGLVLAEALKKLKIAA